MSAATTNDTRIEADPNVPTITIVRDFDAPVEKLFRAWTEADLVVQWLGPKSTTMKLTDWEPRTGGSYRYAAWQEDVEVASFYGSFHEVRPSERIVWTFTWEGMPDGVSLETMTFEDLGEGRSRVTQLSVVDNLEARDMIMSSGMDTGVIEGFEKLDALLAYS